MRIGNNPHKDLPHQPPEHLHQVIIPVYIPNFEDYFKDSFEIFTKCIDSLLATTHEKTFITIVDNGSHQNVGEYLEELHKKQLIHEVIHTVNIGKINAVLKGLVGNNIPLVTISDADVLFLDGWQRATADTFNSFPRAGIVGIVPQFRTLNYKNQNLVFSKFFSSKLKFVPVKDKEAVRKFHHSIGWDKLEPRLQQYSLGLEASDGTIAYVGSGHFVATYRKAMFNKIELFKSFLLGGDSEGYLDSFVLKKNLWRLTTYDNYAFHMGNVLEPWMNEIAHQSSPTPTNVRLSPVSDVSSWRDFWINKVFGKVFMNTNFKRYVFYPLKKLPRDIAEKY